MFKKVINFTLCLLDSPRKGDKLHIQVYEFYGIYLKHPTCAHCNKRIMGTEDLGWVHYKRRCLFTD